MIENIKIKYPDFGKGLDINIDLNPGITIIQEPNGWGKSTIINTIHSFFTNKYTGLTKLPKGTASISGKKINGIMSRNKWSGNIPIDKNELYKYIIPGKFFEESTTKQRELFVKLLEINYASFMQKLIPDFYEGIETDLKKTLNDYLSKEEILLTDIMELKDYIINNSSTEDFTDIELFIKQKELLFKETDKYNSDLSTKLSLFKDLEKNIHSIKKYQIPDIITDINIKNDNINLMKDENNCTTCGQIMPEEKIKEITGILSDELKLLKETLAKKKTELSKLEDEFLLLKEPKYLDVNNFKINAKIFSIELPKVDMEKHKRYNEIKLNEYILEEKKKELKEKEDLLKSFDTVGIDKKINDIKISKEKFIVLLEKKIKVFDFKISLFKVHKNGNIKPSFLIEKDGVEYNKLSTGNKIIINIMIAKVFCDKLGVPLLMIDEASYLSKNNLKYIKKLENQGYQILICKPTEWNLTDFN